MVVSSTAAAFKGVSLSALYERFLRWWVSLYANPPRNLRRMI
jgi:hypothetical protein